MWGMLAVLALITIILSSFILPRNLMRLVTLAGLWIVSFEILELVVALFIINTATFSKPDPDLEDNSS